MYTISRIKHQPMTDREKLLSADPVGLTQREMLWRLDARLDKYDERLRAVEDEQLVGRTERKTIRALVAGSLMLWPVVTFVLINVIHIG